MNLVLDTNVFVSGIFYSGPPYRILQAWRDGIVQKVTSPEILDEYARVLEELGIQHPEVSISPIIDFITLHTHIVLAPPLPAAVCADPDDDMFIACAIASNTKLIVSGDKHLLSCDRHKGIEVLKPRAFIEKYLL